MLATWSTAISHESIVDAFINTHTTVTQTCVNNLKHKFLNTYTYPNAQLK